MTTQRLLFGVLILSMGVKVASACECPVGTHKENFRSAKQIFLGEVVSVGKSKTLNPKITDVPIYAVSFKVDRRWKGPNANEVTVLTDSCANMCCRVQFREGEKYLVYVYRDSFLPSTCSWSGELTAPWVTKQLKELDRFWFRLSARLHI